MNQSLRVIVTGGGQGIGRAIASAFARNGSQVIIADVDNEAGYETVELITSQGGQALFVSTNVASELEVRRLMETGRDRYGGIDVLVNNAGIGISKPLFDLTMEEFDKVLSVNLRGTFLCSKLAAPMMKEQGKGVIINIASTRALMSEANTESYSASKGGIVALTHAMAVSLGPYGIRVNAISPGWIETGDWKKEAEKCTPQHSKEDMEQHPVRRVGQPMDIAEAVLYLSSEQSGFITGQNMVIDGGMTIKMIYE